MTRPEEGTEGEEAMMKGEASWLVVFKREAATVVAAAVAAAAAAKLSSVVVAAGTMCSDRLGTTESSGKEDDRGLTGLRAVTS